MKKITFLLLALVQMIVLYGQEWSVLSMSPKGHTLFGGELPLNYAFFEVHSNDWLSLFEKAPFLEENLESSTEMLIPVNNEGETETFKLYRTALLSEKLAKKYPEIITIKGKSKSGRIVYITYTPFGTDFIIQNGPEGTYLIKPYTKDTWIGYFIKDIRNDDQSVRCLTDEVPGENYEMNARPLTVFSDSVLHIFDFAVAVTHTYCDYHFQRLGISSSASDAVKRAAIMGEITRAVNRMNSVFERDVATRFRLVTGNDQLIFYDASTDPYNGYNGWWLMNRNQQVVDSIIGNNHYDLSEVWTYVPHHYYGMTGGRICSSSSKGSCYASGDALERDRFICRSAAHETGHLFGAQHVFNNPCGYPYSNRNISTAVEPGGGNTIMAYPHCEPNYSHNTSDARFNTVSIMQMRTQIEWSSCYDSISVSNHAPVITASPNKTIPRHTPFVIFTSASDPDGDVLGYTWDEADVPSPEHDSISQPDWTDGPMFRTYAIRHRNYRFFPAIDSIIRYGTVDFVWEVLPDNPSASRHLTFNETVRDNNLFSGRVANHSLVLTVDSSSGPFRLTSQLTNETWNTGQTVNVTWDVAGTDRAPVNCATVDILFSRNGGYEITDTLALSVPNNGSYTFNVPYGLATPAGRLFVKAHDNYFFDVSRGNIKVGDVGSQECGIVYSSNPEMNIPDDDFYGITDTIHVDENFYITDVDVMVNISHLKIRDLMISVTDPRENTVYLFTGQCNDSTIHVHEMRLLFDDESVHHLACDGDTLSGDLPPLDRFHVEDLSRYYGHFSKGDWILRVYDSIPENNGILHGWELHFCKKNAVMGIGEKLLTNVEMYPNPVKDKLHVSFLDRQTPHTDIMIFDMAGRLIWQGRYENIAIRNKITFSLDIGHLKTGNYIFQLRTGPYSYRSIIQKL